MRQNVFTILMLSLLVISAAALSACNTVEGFGQDLQSAGQSIEKRAEK